jgi:16S rRNA (guanine527-N7)-methyltransferase
MRLHILDSLTLLKYIKKPGASMIDVGTGGGFPGIPLCVMLPECHITMMDATKKKLKVIEKLALEIGVNNCIFLHGRAEELGQEKTYREQYDYAVSRAVANLTLLSEYCLPYIKVGGFFLSMKGRDYIREIKEAEKIIETLGGKIKSIEESFILQNNGVHVIINIEKKKKTPPEYPRTIGKIKKTGFSGRLSKKS